MAVKKSDFGIREEKPKEEEKSSKRTMSLWVLAIALLIAASAIVYFSGAQVVGGWNPQGNQSQPGPSLGQAAVSIQNNAFSQTSISLAVGNTVTWTNYDERIHYVQVIGVTSSPALHTGEQWTYTFSSAGTFEFRDADLPYMRGTVTVS